MLSTLYFFAPGTGFCGENGCRREYFGQWRGVEEGSGGTRSRWEWQRIVNA